MEQTRYTTQDSARVATDALEVGGARILGMGLRREEAMEWEAMWDAA
jgi:hypothetical protein